jgi:hypothetical protein
MNFFPMKGTTSFAYSCGLSGKYERETQRQRGAKKSPGNWRKRRTGQSFPVQSLFLASVGFLRGERFRCVCDTRFAHG